MIFTIDRALEIGSWLDYGMFLENIMVAARGRGLDTCPQAAFAPFHKVIRVELGIPESEIVICGMSLGYGDPDAPENGLVTERASIGEFATFHDV
jgi:nitroreductase